jgi:ammonium transporter Rh
MSDIKSLKKDKEEGEGHEGIHFSKQELSFLVCEAICILFYGLFTTYDGPLTSPLSDAKTDIDTNAFLKEKYPLFQDVHIMIFVGFGFLMVFLKNNSLCSVGFNYLIACWAIQIAILFTGFWHNVVEFYHDPNHEWKKIELTVKYMILGDFAAGAVLISFGAILGKVSLFQLWAMATLEVFFYCLNEAIVVEIFKIYDIGGSIVIHTFGAFFGLSVCLFYQSEDAIKDRAGLNIGNYLSDLVSMIGTLFLYAYWPSFNAALGSGTYIHRAAINTYLAIACSVIASIIISKLVHGGKLNMEIVLNASVSGGVAVGSAADLIVSPCGSMIAGFVTGCISAVCFAKLSPFVKKHLVLHDTCGVMNLHAIPGVIGALISAIVATRVGETTFGDSVKTGGYAAQAERSPYEQAGYQLAGLGVALGIAVLGGLFTGFVTSRQWFDPVPVEYLFHDRHHFAECVIEHEELHILKEKMNEGGFTFAGSKEKSDSKAAY